MTQSRNKAFPKNIEKERWVTNKDNVSKSKDPKDSATNSGIDWRGVNKQNRIMQTYSNMYV